MKIGKRTVGPGEPIYVIAELSANHGQDYDRAVKLVEAAKQSGADAVKVQTYSAETMTLDNAAPLFRIGGGTPWDGKRLFDLYREASMPWEWTPKLKSLAEGMGLDFFSTAYDPSAVAFLETLKVAAHKIASFELVDHALIEAMARTGKPLFLSTGMASLSEIEEAVGVARRSGAKQIALLKCTSAYPASAPDMHLSTIGDLTTRFQVPVGLSDHSLGLTVPVAAVAAGACFIEKHLTLRRSDGGPDAAFSLEPVEFKAMSDAVREAKSAMGNIHYGPTRQEEKSLAFRRSLFVVKPLRAGEKFTGQNVRSIRPALGLAPKFLPEVLGKTATANLEAGTPLAWEHVKKP